MGVGSSAEFDADTFDWSTVDGSKLIDKALEATRKLDGYKKLKLACRRGLSHNETRLTIWRIATDSKESDQRRYEELSGELFDGIDSLRDFPSFPLFGSKCVFQTLSVAKKLSALRILVVCAVEHDSLKYCPVLPFIVEYILGIVERESLAFSIVNSMLAISKRNGWYFRFDFFNFRVRISTFMSILEKNCKKLSNYLIRTKKLPLGVIIAEMFATFYTNYLNYDCLLHLLDCFCVEGYKILFRVGVALFLTANDELIKSNDKIHDLNDLRRELMKISRKITPSILLKSAFAMSLQRSHFDNLDRIHRTKILSSADGSGGGASGKGIHESIVRRWPNLNDLNKIDRKIDSKCAGRDPFTGIDPRHPLFSNIIIGKKDFLQLWVWLPPGCHSGDFHRLFDTAMDGYNLDKLYQCCDGAMNLLLLIETRKGIQFGIHLSMLELNESHLYSDPGMVCFVLKGEKELLEEGVIAESDLISVETSSDPTILSRRVFEPSHIQFNYLRQKPKDGVEMMSEMGSVGSHLHSAPDDDDDEELKIESEDEDGTPLDVVAAAAAAEGVTVSRRTVAIVADDATITGGDVPLASSAAAPTSAAPAPPPVSTSAMKSLGESDAAPDRDSALLGQRKKTLKHIFEASETDFAVFGGIEASTSVLPPQSLPTNEVKIHASKSSLVIQDKKSTLLQLDSALNRGISEECPALNCPSLVAQRHGEFQVKHLEVWTVYPG